MQSKEMMTDLKKTTFIMRKQAKAVRQSMIAVKVEIKYKI